ncbi:MAG: transposase [Candidatus Scalindua sp.]|nr:transposase [Candidatus Scalindua sp.]
MARTHYKVIEDECPHFFTCTVINWISLFTNRDIVEIILVSLNHLQIQKHLKIFGYVIMENHLHLIASGNNLAREIGHFKSFTARKIIDYLCENNINVILKQLQFHKLKHKKDRTYQLWQEGSHPKLIQGEKMMTQKMEYMHCNPVKRGYVDDPIHWRYSSARNYAEQESLLEVCTEW